MLGFMTASLGLKPASRQAVFWCLLSHFRAHRGVLPINGMAQDKAPCFTPLMRTENVGGQVLPASHPAPFCW